MSYKTSLTTALNSCGSNRADVFNEVIGNITIDTCYCPDTNEWETGIETDKWYIVEHYPKGREDAKVGHDKWCQKVRNGEKQFTDCNDIEYDF